MQLEFGVPNPESLHCVEGRIVWRQTLLTRWRGMTGSNRSFVLGARVSFDTRARFTALAAHHQLSAAGLLAKLVDEVLGASSAGTSSHASHGEFDAPEHASPDERITLRLRPGDRALISRSARARGMKTCSYLTLLVHNHVRRSAVLPPDELDQLKVTCARLGALGRLFRMFGMPNSVAGPQAEELRNALAEARREIEVACELTAGVVQRNHISWETGNETNHD